ncbi:RimK family alpha-L-glutamate ligase, partial [Halobacterium sp. CBA1126]|uniref:ATP-grasp domain-containing protein n=1 Tax=Halobacterium sp. CBA1126 TaxID=2668074 RepID=UPI0012FBC841
VREHVTDLEDPPFDPENFDAGFVFPGRLMEGGVVDAFLDVPWVNDRAAVLRSRNKAGALATLADAGVPVPETVYVSNPADEDDVRAAFAAFDPPVVVKPNSTTRGVGVTKVHDADSLSGVTDYLELVHDYRATGDKSYLVQEFLPDAADYRVMVLDGEVVGAVQRTAPDGWKHNVHRGADAAGVALPEDLRALAVDAADALDVPFLGVDLLVSGDRAVVSETNARPTIDSEEKYDAGFYDRLAALVERTADR